MEKGTKIRGTLYEVPFCKDLEEATERFLKWHEKYSENAKKLSQYEAIFGVMQGQLKMAKDNENAANFKMMKYQSLLFQAQKNTDDLLSAKEKLLRMQEESVNLEILHRSTLEKAEKNWLAEVTKRDQEIANLRQIFSENEANLMNKFMIEKQGLEKMVADIENARNNEKIEAERVLSRTISLYEEKLMKMNEDLASSQTEMRNLRQRLASLKYSQENKMGSLKPGEDCLQVPPNLSQGQLPVPVQQLTPRLANGPYASAPQVNSLPHYNYYDVLSAMGTHESAYKGHQPVQSSPVHQVVNGQRTMKVSFPVAKKRKLYSKSNEML